MKNKLKIIIPIAIAVIAIIIAALYISFDGNDNNQISYKEIEKLRKSLPDCEIYD